MSMMETYGQIFLPFFERNQSILTPDGRKVVARWAEWIEITRQSAASEAESNFSVVCNRSLIALSNLMENCFESILVEALDNASNEFLGRLIPAKKLKKLQETSPERRVQELKWIVRDWERRLFETTPNSRSRRMEQMLCTLFPNTEFPNSAEQIDRLFDIRNELTHKLISFRPNEAEELSASLKEVDDFFDIAGEILLSLMKSVPHFAGR